MTNDELRARYGASEQGNYFVSDTTCAPHFYCIGGKHVAHASDNFGGRLGDEAIRDGEKHGINCAHPRCTLSYDQHEKALVVTCAGPLKTDDGIITPELHSYLLQCKPLCEADKFAGFAFVEGKPS